MPGQPLQYPFISESIASIREEQSRVLEVRCELQEVIATTHDLIFQSKRLVEKAHEALARSWPPPA